ncbi:MAG: GTPase domain-containing protein [Myxococcota bacterium]|nr:GTPase domain-containing protein [Myxococcota bacterium]
MAQVDFTERQLTLKLVYYGPPLSGKTSNLRVLHGAVAQLNRGRLMTLDTRDDRTLFFDLLPIFFRASGFSFRIKVYTVPGQPVHEATRRVVLTGADGVVFVADSQPDQREANQQSWDSLRANLSALELDQLPVVVQYNKRDLPDAIALATADHFGDPARPLQEACAKQGDGVVATFFDLVGRSWDFLDQDLKLTDKLGIDSAAFRRALADHVGGPTVTEPGRIPR